MEAKEVYFNRDMMNHHGGVSSGRRLSLRILQRHPHLHGIRDGKGDVEGPERGQGIGGFCRGHLYLFSEKNVVGLAEATTEGYREKGRFEVADQGWPSWAHPVVSGGRLYGIRNQGVLNCYDVLAARPAGRRRPGILRRYEPVANRTANRHPGQIYRDNAPGLQF